MPRYSDEWVVDRVLFDYINGGSCACCGISHALFLPNGTSDLITNNMTELETDQIQNEISVLQSNNHPWPIQLREQIWYDRVKLKQKLKSTIHKYTNFWYQHHTNFTKWLLNNNESNHTDNVDDIADDNNEPNDKEHPNAHTSSSSSSSRQHKQHHVFVLQKLLHISYNEFKLYTQQTYNIHSAYMVVLEAVMEQVAYFNDTKYKSDSNICGSNNDTEGRLLTSSYKNDPTLALQYAEYEFEQILQFRDRTGFTISLQLVEEQQQQHQQKLLQPSSTYSLFTTTDNVLHILLNRIRTLGSGKLLGRKGPSSSTITKKVVGRTKKHRKHSNIDDGNDDDDENEDESDDDNEEDDDDDADGPVRMPLNEEAQSAPSSSSSSSSTYTKCNIPTPSFQSDRRMIRLILARYWADILIKQYYADTNDITVTTDDKMITRHLP